MWNLCCGSDGNKSIVNVRCARVCRSIRKDSELLRLQEWHRRHFDQRICLFEVMVEPAEDRDLQILSIFMRAGANHQSQVAVGLVKLINASDFPMKALNP